MKCYLYKSPDGRIFALNSENSLSGDAYRELTPEEYGRVDEWGEGREQVGNARTIVQGDTLEKATVQFLARSSEEVNAAWLEATKSALTTVDAMAEDTRALFITQGDGQAMVYQEKVSEAERVMALADDATLEPALYPLLAAEAAALGSEVKVLAETILTLRTQWLQVAAQIEATRIKAKEDVKAAQNPEQIQTILNGLTWPAAS